MQEKAKQVEELNTKLKGMDELLKKREEAIETYKKKILQLE